MIALFLVLTNLHLGVFSVVEQTSEFLGISGEDSFLSGSVPAVQVEFLASGDPSKVQMSVSRSVGISENPPPPPPHFFCDSRE